MTPDEKYEAWLAAGRALMKTEEERQRDVRVGFSIMLATFVGGLAGLFFGWLIWG